MNVNAIAPFVLGTCVLVTASAATGATTATVTGVNFLKVRAAPSFDAAETTILTAGDTVEVLEEIGPWASIVLPNGTRGYASRKYLALTAPADPTRAGNADAAGGPSAQVQGAPAVGDDRDGAAEHDAGAAADERDGGGSSDADAAATTERAPPPLEQAAVPAPTPTPPIEATPNPACTKADLDALGAEVRALASRFDVNGVVAAADNPRSRPRPQPRISPNRSQLVWFGIGGVLGWLLGRFVSSRDRWRRNRIRI